VEHRLVGADISSRSKYNPGLHWPGPSVDRGEWKAAAGGSAWHVVGSWRLGRWARLLLDRYTPVRTPPRGRTTPIPLDNQPVCGAGATPEDGGPPVCWELHSGREHLLFV